VCQRCGAVEPLPPSALEALSAAVLDAVGYRADFTHFAIPGRCPACIAGGPSRQ
jgi:Fe2+ or Zn2+ uptake regulation protein